MKLAKNEKKGRQKKKKKKKKKMPQVTDAKVTLQIAGREDVEEASSAPRLDPFQPCILLSTCLAGVLRQVEYLFFFLGER